MFESIHISAKHVFDKTTHNNGLIQNLLGIYKKIIHNDAFIGNKI
ncbi:hypothetical protein EM595_0158 [Duffyella gerundensis]|uniref:Uncharacterized protein n=1 Tax=Duffyella gerundensis TaxID=1619313 RepID=A0A0U5KZT3_9GAMM|nr:hypothetical protein EM595_0158 [Duffyella gerundensis]